MRRTEDLEASLYKNGHFALSMAAAYALGQIAIDAKYFERPTSERDLLSVSLEWDQWAMRLTLRGGEGPFKLHVYSRSLVVQGKRKLIRPLFLIIIPSKFLLASKGLRVRSTHRFKLARVADRALVLDREGGGVKTTPPAVKS